MDFGPVIFGGNVFGWTVDRDHAFALLDAFVAGGGHSIDTSDSYPPRVGAQSEEIIGEWLTARRNRDQIQIATKVSKLAKRPGLGAANIRAAIDDSLRRLQTDRVDIYYAHADDETVPQAEYLEAFDDLVEAGKVRTLGASNFTAARLDSALAYQAAHGLAKFAVAQDHYNLVERDVERTLLPTLQRAGIAELPYFSLASGFLTGKYKPGAKVDSARAGIVGKYLEQPSALAVLAAATDIAAAHRVSVVAVALAWLKAQPVVGAPIASARTVEQLAPLFETVSLTPDELARLSA